MKIYDLCLIWEWQYDADFVTLLEAACKERGISFVQIHPGNLDTVFPELINGKVFFRALLDRASDSHPRFLPLAQWARGQALYRYNSFELARRAWDKAIIHEVFNQAGLLTPATIVLPPFLEQAVLEEEDLGVVGCPFSIKPAHGGGGKGVIPLAYDWDQVLKARQEYPDDKYLLQAYVSPIYLQERPAWFRIIYCLGEILLHWWDPATHVYTPLTIEDENCYGLEPLREITGAIARLSNLDLFSTEIAYPIDGSFVIIDYINDPIDLRLQSNTFEGVPDATVKRIVERIASHAAAILTNVEICEGEVQTQDADEKIE